MISNLVVAFIIYYSSWLFITLIPSLSRINLLISFLLYACYNFTYYQLRLRGSNNLFGLLF